MSDSVKLGLNLSAAVRFNARRARELGWYGMIPEDAVLDFPGLGVDPLMDDAGEVFAAAVAAFQERMGFPDHECDGMMGSKTWMAMVEEYAPVEQSSNYVLLGGNRLKVPDFPVITFDERDGLDLHRDGGWRKSKSRDIRLIVLHWGGLDPGHCRRTLANRDLSSHFGVGKSAAFQWLDMAHVAYHAGYVNSFSVGIDICEQPETKWKDWYGRRGFNREEVKNTTGRGARRVLSLDPRTALHTRMCVEALCDVLDVPYNFPRGEDGLDDTGDVWHGTFPKDVIKSGAFQGVIGHHHLSARKWDVACYWDQIFNDNE